MALEITSQSHSSHGPIVVKPLDEDLFIRRMQKVFSRIERRAYELFERRGRQDGHDLEDWLRAESDLLYPVPVKIKNIGDKLVVHGDVPGFRDNDIEVRVKPHCLVIAGRKRQLGDATKGRALSSERTSEVIFRIVDLPQEIDPDNVTARLQHGTLEIALPKARSGKGIAVVRNAA
ncbi:MAG: Hsp20 family protein [Candidatus Korobacteraceae bacterium]